ncbi:hypothetical protein [Pseudomonas aeruginosa]|uniref:hypothetical protein n=1 Tax=Pseudomonas aeruginosa TaxID=287 RepID=UPI003F58FCB3
MSEEINVLREDIRVTVSVAPEFPKERLLPLEPSVLSKNISRQVKEERKYNEEKIKRIGRVAEKAVEYLVVKLCM